MTTRASFTFRLDDTATSNLPQTWLRYLNGPNAGFIDVELAKQEVPWLVGIPRRMTFRSAEPTKVRKREPPPA
jgi:hypothetical protein